jgi:hypothetical protein
MGSAFRRERHAIHHGHGDIEQDDIRGFAGGGLEGLDAVRGEDDIGLVGRERLVDKDVDHAAVVHAENLGYGHVIGYLSKKPKK